MADHSFDRLLCELCEALDAAQAGLQGRREQLLAGRLCGDQGPVCLPVQVQRADGWETLQVPLSELVEDRQLGIVELSVELRCEIDLIERRQAPALVALRPGDEQAPHRLRLVVRGPGPGRGQAFLDGIGLGAFGPEGLSA